VIPGSILLWLGRHWPTLACAAAVIGAAWYLDHRGYQRAKADAERRQLADAVLAEQKTRRIEKALVEAVAKIDANTGKRISAIDITERTIVQPTLQKEIRSEVRFTDPAAGITVGMLGALNAARAASCATAADGAVTCALPAAEPAP
jgi:hypothetical protein